MKIKKKSKLGFEPRSLGLTTEYFVQKVSNTGQQILPAHFQIMLLRPIEGFELETNYYKVLIVTI